MAGRLKVYNLSTGAWEYVNTTQALRFIPVTFSAWDLNASVGNTAEQVLELAASIPANVPGIVAVSLYGLVRDQATASGAAGGANTTVTITDASGVTINLFIDKDGPVCGSSTAPRGCSRP